ncbi:MAG: SDR family oxidoreductase [Gammaproteobacteria bacterium]|jgi:short-subunit dehydrogenase
MKLENSTVLITGASGGIGETICNKLVDAGARLIAVGNEVEKLERLVQSLPGMHAWVSADLTTAEGIQAVADEVDRQGGVDILINNAGVARFGFLAQQSEGDLSAQITVNLLAPMLLTRALLPTLMKSSSPSIVNMGSTFGSIGYSGFTGYCASKFGLRGFTEALRRELADTPIRIFYIAPRATRTPINNEQVMAMNQALGNKMDEPEVVADHLLSMLLSRRTFTRYIGWPEKMYVFINNLIPQVVDKAMRKQLPVIRRFARS